MSKYTWEPGKAAGNVAKHGITFEEAETAAESPLAVWSEDRSYAGNEVRSLVLAYSDRGRLLVVITSEREPRPRIISARRATKREQHAYETRS